MKSIVLGGIEGSNPLGFLTAVGALRLFDMMWREQGVRLRWIRRGGWRPEVLRLPIEDELELCRLLHDETPWAPLEVFKELGSNLTVTRPLFESVVRSASAGTTAADRRAPDFAAAFASDVFEDKDKGRVEYTDLCFITGSGHQDFLGTANGLARCTGPEHLREALFGPWRYADKGLSMRWDPDDAKEYALRWRDPSIGGASSVWGASRLAFEALPLFSTVPTETGLRTTGFRKRNRAHEFTFPIWTQPASIDTVRSLIALRELGEDTPDRMRMHAMGVEDIFRAQRVRIGQGANFKVSFRPTRAV
ncbi:MAG: hypothetical protein ABSH32_24835 [Bryobacteraceae bacterium]|jgi:hypothetical protein